MKPEIIILLPVFLFLIAFLFLMAIKPYQRKNHCTGNDLAKNINIIVTDKNIYMGENGFPTRIIPIKKMDGELKDETARIIGTDNPGEKRKYPRKEFECFVDFVKEGRLFKESSKNLSYSGVFLKSNKPDKYNIDDSLMLTFQISNGQPQKHKGRVVRKKNNGIGVQFLKA